MGFASNEKANEVEKFWKANKFSDLDIHCGMDGGVIQAHCLVLASISPVFKRVLKPIYDHYTDNERAVLIIPGIQSTVLKSADVFRVSSSRVAGRVVAQAVPHASSQDTKQAIQSLLQARKNPTTTSGKMNLNFHGPLDRPVWAC